MKQFQTLAEVKDYLSHDKLKCLICGKEYKGLNSHIAQAHEVTAREYKLKFNIPLKHGYGLIGTQTKEKLRIRNANMSEENRRKFYKGRERAINRLRGAKIRNRQWTEIGKRISQANVQLCRLKLKEMRKKKVSVFCKYCGKELKYSPVDIKGLNTKRQLPVCVKCESKSWNK